MSLKFPWLISYSLIISGSFNFFASFDWLLKSFFFYVLWTNFEISLVKEILVTNYLTFNRFLSYITDVILEHYSSFFWLQKRVNAKLTFMEKILTLTSLKLWHMGMAWTSSSNCLNRGKTLWLSRWYKVPHIFCLTFSSLISYCVIG